MDANIRGISKMLLHAVKYPHSTCSGFLLARVSDDIGDEDSAALSIVDAIPISHTSHGLSPIFEMAFQSVGKYAKDKNLKIVGYYQADKFNQSGIFDPFQHKIIEKISESFPNPTLFLVNFEGDEAKSKIEAFQLVDGRFRPQKDKLNSGDAKGTDVITLEKILFSKEQLYRRFHDFDDHFNDISKDWSNKELTSRIDEIIAKS